MNLALHARLCQSRTEHGHRDSSKRERERSTTLIRNTMRFWRIIRMHQRDSIFKMNSKVYLINLNKKVNLSYLNFEQIQILMFV